MADAEHVADVLPHHDKEAGDVGMGTFVLALTLGIACRAWLSKWTRLPYTCLVLLLGLLYGFVLYTEVARTGPDLISLSADLWINISPEAILTVILPVLIFGSSFACDLHLFLQLKGPILTLAGPAVLINTAILGVSVKYVLPYGWDWPTSFMVASILAATDPVAVVAILKELGVAESLSTLIDGESLLNDGVAIVLYSIFSHLVVHEESFSPMGTFEEALVLCLGGPAIGVGVGIAASTFLGFLINDPASEITVTIVAGYGSYLLAELAEASGVLSMVAAGLYLSYHGLGRISARVTESLHSFWEMAEWIANTLIFFLSGLIMAERALVSATVHGVDWAYLLLVYVILNITRAFGVLICFPVLVRGPYGISLRQAVLLSWGGLRGAVSLTLSIAVSQVEGIPEETRARISFLIAGIVLLTILINGTTCKPLLNRLGLNNPSEAERELFIRATNMVEGGLEKALRELKRDKYLGDADWNIVFRYLPVPTAQVYWHRVQAGHLKLNEEELALIGAYVQGGVEDRMLTNKMSAQEAAGLGIPAAPMPLERLSPAVTWMTSLGRWLQGGHWSLIPGSKYEELPPRLRNRWRRYTLENNDLGGVLHGDKLMVIREATYERLINPLVLPEENWEDDKEEVVVDGGTGKAIHVHELNVSAMMDDYEQEGSGDFKRKKKLLRTNTTAVPTSQMLAASPAFVVPPVPRAKSFTVAVTANQPRLHTGPMTTTPALGPIITEGEEEECEDDVVVECGKASGTKVEENGDHALSFAQSLAEARLRLMTILKHVYWGSFQSGLLSPTGIRAFDSNMALLVLTPHKELDEWTALETRVLLALRTMQENQRWRRLPLVGKLVQTMLFNRLAFFFELAMVFIEAHSNVDLEGLFGVGPMARQLAREVDAEVLRAKAALKEFLPVFPDIINSVKTEIAARFLLNKYRSLLEHAVESGSLEQKEFDTGIKAVDASMVKLYDHTHNEIAAPRPVLLNNLSFLHFLSQDEKLRFFGTKSTLCRDVYVRSETTFMNKGTTDLKGWYVIVRGSVLSGYGDSGEEGGEAMVEEEESILQNGAILGFIEALLQSPTQPVPHSYTAASFVHLLYFDRAAILQEAERHPALARSLWWVLAAFELRRNEELGLQSCSMNQLGTLLADEKLLYVPMHGNVSGVGGTTTKRGGGGGRNSMSGRGSGEKDELTHSASNSNVGLKIFKSGSLGATLRSAISSSSNAMAQEGQSEGGEELEIKQTHSGLHFMGSSGGGHQVLNSDGNCHLVLLTGRLESAGEEGEESVVQHSYVAPPVRVIPFLTEGNWWLSRGTVGFYLNEDHCQALVQPPDSQAGQSGGGVAVSFTPMLYRFTSMVGPKAFKSAPGGSGPLLIYPMAMREASQNQACLPQPARKVAHGARKLPRGVGGVTWGCKEGEKEEEEEEEEDDDEEAEEEEKEAEEEEEEEEEKEESDGSDEAAVGAMLRQRMSQKVASRRWL
ncbi:sodium hydrogen exchanger partial [Nannochloropsis oceanica]